MGSYPHDAPSPPPRGPRFANRTLDAAVTALQWSALTVGQAGPLRRRIVQAYDRRIRAQYARAMAGVRNPAMLQHRMDLALSILYTMDRAMEYGTLGAATMRGILSIIGREILFPQFDPAVRKAFQATYGTIPPGLLAISPLKACNLHCEGCFTDSGPAREKLEWATLSRLVREARQMWGAHFFVLAGGEPLMYKDEGKRILDLAEEYRDCFFLMYTNGTLIDDTTARWMGQLGNVTPAISVEGMREATDRRRGEGVLDRVVAAMERLRREHVPYGLSITVTRHNVDEVLSDELLDLFYGQMHVMYAWLFHYMPIGRAFTLDLMLTPEQRLRLYERMWDVVGRTHYFVGDFWNSGVLADGCLAAGGRGGYMYIDWNGHITPCAFVPYSPVNIRDIYAQGKTLNDVWSEPFFASIRQWQQEYNPGMGAPRPHHNGNLMRPCIYRDHHAKFMELVAAHEPDPIDENAEAALLDADYHAGMEAFDRELAALEDPIWESRYLGPEDRSG